MNKQTLMLSLLIALAPSMAMSASVYKWTDENGVTHFGDRQPVGTNSESINVRSGTSSGAGNSRPSPQQRLGELQEQQQQKAARENETAVEAARRKQREANCETARSNLKVIESNARIRVEENGEQRYLTPEEIAEQKMKFEEVASENCGPEEAQQ
ncbi:DUF4124 domain-containing protein [Marinobacter salexigens]|uniref:DUF4124 domain-containing protein n=1 Tax=Marinobacter salexigens TaxID=1925763 RepID=UPI000C286EC5|nr:DUF4124 domain-containing protein [Marinobacter salexigens]